MKLFNLDLKIAFIVVVATLSGIATVPAFAQSAADNIRPVGEVCLQDQACVGQVAGGGASQAQTSAPASAAPAAPAAPAASTPAAATAVADAGSSDFDAEAAYNMSCMACHTTGAAGAPMLGDEAAWNARMEKGKDAVMQNVFNGLNAMPARGLCASCSDDDLSALVDYMVNHE